MKENKIHLITRLTQQQPAYVHVNSALQVKINNNLWQRQT